jgi:hypothetical protein
VGYRFGQFDIGAQLIYGKNTMPDTEVSIFGVGVLFDYKLLTIEKFSVLGRASFTYLHTLITEDGFLNITGTAYPYSSTIDLNTTGFSVEPVFEYKLFNRLSLYASIGGISFSRTKGKDNTNIASIVDAVTDITGSNTTFSFSSDLTLGFYVFF